MNNPMGIMQMLAQTPNPNMLIAQIYGKHPQYNRIMQIVQGKSPQELEQYVKNLCQTQGINISNVAKQFGLNISA